MTDVFKMKYRVIFLGDRYYPQYKSWWSFGWMNFLYNREARSYFDKDYAISFCCKNDGEVVWESDPKNNHCMTTGPE